MFLLVAMNSKYIHSNPAVYSLRGYLNDTLLPRVSISEYTINQSVDEVLADIVIQAPKAIGFSCYIWNIKLIRELLVELPKLLPATAVWLGGPEVSFRPEELLTELPSVTGIMVGEGEETFRELVTLYAEQEILSEKMLQQVAGLCLHSGRTGERAALDLNRLPYLYQQTDAFQNRIIYYESSRGCPYQCSYCLSSVDRTLRFRDPEIVKQELQHLLDKEVKQVKFVDRTFNCKESHALAIWNYIKEHDNGVTNFHFEIAADHLTDAELALLCSLRPGLVQLEIGVQTINPHTLNAINRVTDLDRLAMAVTTLRERRNMLLHLDLIAGLPYEGYNSFARSFDFVYALQPQQLQLGFLKVLHGTQLEQDAGKYGICFKNTPPYEVLYTDALSYTELRRLKAIEEMVELYYNSGQFVTTLSALVQEFLSPFRLYEALAAFYKEKGYFLNQPARAYRYEVLLAFIEEKVLSGSRDSNMVRGADYYKECLTYDLYLREKIHSRPTFARDLHPSYEAIKSVYEQEEKERTLLPAYQRYDRKQMEKMTHIEVFTYRVWEVNACTKADQPMLVLFDYLMRDVLTGNALTTVI